MTVEKFRQLVAEARAVSQACCYCGRDLSNDSDVMYMKRQKRIACAECPEAIVVSFNQSSN